MSSGTPKAKPEHIQFVGVSELSPEDQESVSKITTEHYDKIKRSVHNLTNLTVHVKTYQQDGNRKKYSMHVRVDTPTKQQFVSTNSDDWELPKALHKAFEDIMNQIHHKLHTDVSRPS